MKNQRPCTFVCNLEVTELSVTHSVCLSVLLSMEVYITLGRTVWNRVVTHSRMNAGMLQPSAAH